MDELKPCPFCGGRAAIIDLQTIDGSRCKAVECRRCGAMMPGVCQRNSDDVSSDWNARWVRTCQMLNDDWDDSFGEYKHLYECGICSESTALLCCINENGDTEWVKPKFCGNCGAEVDE